MCVTRKLQVTAHTALLAGTCNLGLLFPNRIISKMGPSECGNHSVPALRPSGLTTLSTRNGGEHPFNGQRFTSSYLVRLNCAPHLSRSRHSARLPPSDTMRKKKLLHAHKRNYWAPRPCVINLKGRPEQPADLEPDLSSYVFPSTSLEPPNPIPRLPCAPLPEPNLSSPFFSFLFLVGGSRS